MEAAGVTAEEAARGAALALAVCLGAGSVASACAHKGTAKWRHNFCALILLAAVVAQYYYLTLLAFKLPDGVYFIRKDCRQSNKGGKLVGSMRDCLDTQPRTCTREHPCTPCDFPVRSDLFDNLFWLHDCAICSARNPGICQAGPRTGARESEDQQWCKDLAGGGAEPVPCQRCCLNLGKSANGSIIDTQKAVLDNDCAHVFEPANFPWDTSKLLCRDKSFPLATRYGCCPGDSRQKGKAPTTIGDGYDVPACFFSGPNGGPWYYCRDEFDEVTNRAGEVLKVPRGCRVFSNGQPTTAQHCRPPSLL